jgi:hypothetical protein
VFVRMSSMRGSGIQVACLLWMQCNVLLMQQIDGVATYARPPEHFRSPTLKFLSLTIGMGFLRT